MYVLVIQVNYNFWKYFFCEFLKISSFLSKPLCKKKTSSQIISSSFLLSFDFSNHVGTLIIHWNYSVKAVLEA